jgi:hypothetical protein
LSSWIKPFSKFPKDKEIHVILDNYRIQKMRRTARCPSRGEAPLCSGLGLLAQLKWMCSLARSREKR